jgi:TM2 domain-containing membrane protein YozV
MSAKYWAVIRETVEGPYVYEDLLALEGTQDLSTTSLVRLVEADDDAWMTWARLKSSSASETLVAKIAAPIVISIQPDSRQRFVCLLGDQTQGPHDLSRLRAMEAGGLISATTWVRQEGATGEWKTWERVKADSPALLPFHKTPPQLPPRLPARGSFRPANPGESAPSRSSAPALSRAVYIFLAIFLGAFGIHNFYAQHFGRGAIQLVITIFALALSLGSDAPGLGIFMAAILGVWILIEIVGETEDGLRRKLS